MNLSEAQRLARTLMDEHGLAAVPFEFDKSVRRFGCCHWFNRDCTKITLSRQLTLLNEESKVRDVILHEIAHAIVGRGHGHNWLWRQTARKIGCDGKRCYSRKDTNTPAGRYVGRCPNCNQETQPRFARRRLACGRCCKLFNGGKFTTDYLLDWQAR